MVGGIAARMCGWSVADFYRNPERSFLAQTRTQEMFGYEASPHYGYGAFGAWEFGGEIRWPREGIARSQAPEIMRHPVESEEDVDRLRVPSDVHSAGAVPLMLHFSRLQERWGRPVSVHLGSAFTRAANLAGPTRFLRWCLKRPELAHRLVRLSTDFLLSVAALWEEMFPGREVSGSVNVPLESNDLVSPHVVEEFSIPYMRELHDKVLSGGFRSLSLHLCGDHSANLGLWSDIPLARPGVSGTVSVDQRVDLAAAITVFGESAVMKGNLEPEVLQLGEPEEILEGARRVLEVGREAPRGFVLAPGCEIPVDTPPYHVYLLVKAPRLLGRGDSPSSL